MTDKPTKKAKDQPNKRQILKPVISLILNRNDFFLISCKFEVLLHIMCLQLGMKDEKENGTLCMCVGYYH